MNDTELTVITTVSSLVPLFLCCVCCCYFWGNYGVKKTTTILNIDPGGYRPRFNAGGGGYVYENDYNPGGGGYEYNNGYGSYANASAAHAALRQADVVIAVEK